MHPIIVKLQETLAELQQFQQDFYNHSQHELGAVVNSNKLSQADLVDAGYLLRTLSEQADEIRKESRKRMEFIAKILCYQLVQASVENGGEMVLKVRGELATGEPTIKDQPVLPKKGTPEHKLLLAYLEVSEASVDAGLVKPDWTQMGEHVTQLRALGKPLPPGLGQTFPQYGMVYRKTRGVESTRSEF